MSILWPENEFKGRLLYQPYIPDGVAAALLAQSEGNDAPKAEPLLQYREEIYGYPVEFLKLVFQYGISRDDEGVFANAYEADPITIHNDQYYHLLKSLQRALQRGMESKNDERAGREDVEKEMDKPREELVRLLEFWDRFSPENASYLQTLCKGMLQHLLQRAWIQQFKSWLQGVEPSPETIEIWELVTDWNRYFEQLGLNSHLTFSILHDEENMHSKLSWARDHIKPAQKSRGQIIENALRNAYDEFLACELNGRVYESMARILSGNLLDMRGIPEDWRTEIQRLEMVIYYEIQKILNSQASLYTDLRKRQNFSQLLAEVLGNPGGFAETVFTYAQQHVDPDFYMRIESMHTRNMLVLVTTFDEDYSRSEDISANDGLQDESIPTQYLTLIIIRSDRLQKVPGSAWGYAVQNGKAYPMESRSSPRATESVSLDEVTAWLNGMEGVDPKQSPAEDVKSEA